MPGKLYTQLLYFLLPAIPAGCLLSCLYAPAAPALLLAAASFLATCGLFYSAPESQTESVTLLLYGVLVFLPLSVFFSANPPVSVQSATVLLWLLAFLLAVTFLLRIQQAEKRINTAIILLVLTSGLYAVAGLIGVEHSVKFPVLRIFSATIPKLYGTTGIPAEGFPANEIAGGAAFFLPLWIALLLRKDRAIQTGTHLFGWTAGILTVALLLAAQSRGAFLAAFAGTAVALSLSGKRGNIILGAGFVLLVAGILYIGIDTIIGVASYHRRFDSFFPLLSGREDIWLRGWMILRSVPLVGTGFGTFGLLAGTTLPFRRGAEMPFEDAHNFFLQSALDFGIPGLLFILIMGALLLVSLAARYRKTKSPLDAGLLGSFSAFLFFSVTDSVSLNSPAAISYFLLAGISAGMRLPHTESKSSRVTQWLLAGGIPLLTAVVLLWLRPVHEQRAVSNALRCMQRTHPDTSSVTSNIQILKSGEPAGWWYAGLLAQKTGNRETRVALWTELAGTLPEYIPFIAYAAPDDSALAGAILQVVPGNAEAHFWLARTVQFRNPGRCALTYARGLAIDTTDGWAWIGYGNALLATGDTLSAHRAYAKACYRDDPGLNGCWRAARTALALGDTATALHYFETSNFVKAKQRAKELRTQWKPVQ